MVLAELYCYAKHHHVMVAQTLHAQRMPRDYIIVKHVV